MQKIINLLRGYINIEIESPFPERFLNLCAHNGIAFWNIERKDDVIIELTIHAKDIEKAEAFAKRLGGNLKIISKSGALFFLQRFKRRYALLAGFALCIAALLVSGQYIWDFSVEGNKTIPAEEILEVLRETGITIGTPVSAVDIETIRNQVLLKRDDLIWMSVNVTGSHANVVVRERRQKPEIYDQNIPVNIISKRAGLITRVETLSGSSHVAVGDTVTEGQLLVSGFADSPQMGVRLINARSEIYARTWTELNAVMPTGAIGKNYTGNSTTRRAIVFGGNRFNLSFRTSQPYAMYDKIRNTSALRLPFGIVFPISIITETYIEYEPVSYTISEENAESLLRAALEEELAKRVGEGEIISERLTFRKAGGVAIATLAAEAEERIDVSVRVLEE